MAKYKTILKDLDIGTIEASKADNESWQKTLDAFMVWILLKKSHSESELTRKQIQVIRLHDVLAQWIAKYMETEKSMSKENEKEHISLLK